MVELHFHFPYVFVACDVFTSLYNDEAELRLALWLTMCGLHLHSSIHLYVLDLAHEKCSRFLHLWGKGSQNEN
jgi:hypothetical protein